MCKTVETSDVSAVFVYVSSTIQRIGGGSALFKIALSVKDARLSIIVNE